MDIASGLIDGFALALEKYGSGKFAFGDLIGPAIPLARDGIEVDADLADSLPFAVSRLGKYPSSRSIFLRADGGPLRRGDRLVQKDLAETLAIIARDGPRGFYEGEIARKIVAAVNGDHGRMTLEDFQTYRALERAVVRGTYRGREIVSMPPPSSGGVHVIQILNLLEGFELGHLGHNSADALHLIAEASKLAFADSAAHLRDPDFFRRSGCSVNRCATGFCPLN